MKVEKSIFEKVLREAGETSVIHLEGLDTPKDVLIHDVAFNPSRGGVAHVDFYAVDAKKKVSVHVPLEFVGEAPAAKLGGVVTKVLHEVEVTCLPKNIPQHITGDISVLDIFEKQIHISDIPLPAEVAIEHSPDEVVVLVQAVEEETESAGTVDMGAISVEKKGKGEDVA